MSQYKQQKKGWEWYFRFSESYALVFIWILLSIICTVTLSEDLPSLLIDIMMLGITFLLALRASCAQRRTMYLSMAGLGAGMVIDIIASLLLGQHSDWIARIIVALLIAATVISIVRSMLHHRSIKIETILGALCIYLLFGVFFAYLYAIVGSLSPIPVFTQQAEASPGDYLYFSYITLATVGFGDLTPQGKLVRSLVVIEALSGQIYLVTIIALLVSKYGMQRNQE